MFTRPGKSSGMDIALGEAVYFIRKNIEMMKKNVMFLCAMIGSLLMVSCSTTRTAQEIAMDNLLHAQAVEAISKGEFVFEADRLEFRRGRTANVMSNTNFISLKDGVFTVQTSFNGGWPGSNNLGGVTYDSRPTKTEITTDKGGNLNYSVNVQGAVLSARVEITVYTGTNEAIATIYPTFNSNQLTMRGVIVPAEESQVFKGRSL